MATPLALDSPRWATFDTWTGDAASIPGLIEALQKQPEVTTRPEYEELESMIFQQYSCTDAVFAVTPHLVALAEKTEGEDRSELLTLIGFIAATADEDDCPGDLWIAYDESLEATEAKCVEHLVGGEFDIETAYYLAISCFGLARHPLGRLLTDFYWANADAETRAVCPKCGQQIYVAAFDTGLVVRRSLKNPYPPAPDPGAPPEPPEPPAVDYREPNPWEPLVDPIDEYANGETFPDELESHFDVARELAADGLTPEANPSAAFSLFGVMLAIKGFGGQARRYFQASDHITCPKCKERFRFADRWWKLDL